MKCPNPHCRAEMVRSARYANVHSCQDCGYSVTLKDVSVEPGLSSSSKPGAPAQPFNRGPISALDELGSAAPRTCIEPECGQPANGDRCSRCARLKRKREYANKRNAEKRRAADDRPAEVAA